MNKPSPTTEALVARPELTRTELRRVADEFKSERDAAKRDTLRAIEDRNAALAALAAAERELAELRAQQPPREPTEPMLMAGYRAYGKTLYEPRPQGWGECATLIYLAMYDAVCPPRSAEG